MQVTFVDIVGFIGVAFIVATYFLTQIGKMDAARPLYPLLNAAGAALIILSLVFAFNLAAFLMEFFWLLISIVGLVRALRLRTK